MFPSFGSIELPNKKSACHLALYKRKSPSFGSLYENVLSFGYRRKSVRHLALYKTLSVIWLYISKSVRHFAHLAVYKKKESVIWLYIRNIVRHLAL